MFTSSPNTRHHEGEAIAHVSRTSYTFGANINSNTTCYVAQKSASYMTLAMKINLEKYRRYKQGSCAGVPFRVRRILHCLVWACSAEARSPAPSADTATIATKGGTLFSHDDFMSKCDLVLASQSPRRREIVSMMGLAVRRYGQSRFGIWRCSRSVAKFATENSCSR